MRPADFRYLCEFVESRSGIELETKEYLVRQRLRPICRLQGLDTIEQLVQRLQTQAHDELNDQVIEVLTTNETSFFRDNHPFEVLTSRVLPDLLPATGKRTVNIWCSGCATGQEAYSVALSIAEHFPSAVSSNIRIVASDISASMIDQARQGVYTDFQMGRGITPDIRERYFHRHGKGWRINRNIASMIDFRIINIIDALPQLPQMDILLLRNVLIYFSTQVRKRVLNEIHAALRPGGYLFLGVAETNVHMPGRFERIIEGKTLYFRAVKPAFDAQSKVFSPDTDIPINGKNSSQVARLKKL